MHTAISAYLNLKLAHELFQKQFDELRPEERQRIEGVAIRQFALEQRILSSPEAAGVMLPAVALEKGFSEIRERYASAPEFAADLARAGLDEEGLRAAIERDMKVEAILEKIAASAEKVSDTDAEIFYLVHKSRFLRPETRTLRHILITVNPDFAGATREAAAARIAVLHGEALADPARFEALALQHSECPTAMNGGLLGQVRRGQLYPELEPAAFSLDAGGISAVSESPVGFHILKCDAVEAEYQVPFAEARARILEYLETQRRKNAQKAWIDGLRHQRS